MSLYLHGHLPHLNLPLAGPLPRPTGLDPSGRPRTCLLRPPDHVKNTVVAHGATHRHGPDRMAWEPCIPARTINQILRRHGMPLLRDQDPITDNQIRARCTNHRRYQRQWPGELIHVDVKKIGWIPDGGGWRVHGRGVRTENKRNIG